MSHRRQSVIPLMLILIFLSSACGSGPETPPPAASPSAEQTSGTALPEKAVIQGPSCPESFQGKDQIQEQSQIAVQGTIELILGRTPSIPCSWNELEIQNTSLIEEREHEEKWPAEGSTAQPGAPGTEVYRLQALEEGHATLVLPCTCLGEEGAERQVEGTYLLSVTIGEK